MVQPAADEYPYLALDVAISLDGSFSEGGYVSLALSGVKKEFVVGLSEFAVLATLMLEAGFPANAPEWLPRGFLTTARLRDAVQRNSLVSLSPQGSAKAIYKLRRAIAQLAEDAFGIDDGTQFASRVIETSSRGYRLSVPPLQQQIYLVDSDN